MSRARRSVVAVGLAIAAMIGPAVAASASTKKAPSVAALTKEFLADVAPVNTAVVTWANRMKALPSGATWAQLGKIGHPLANALGKFDGQVERFGASGNVETAITQFVRADENFIVDLTTAAGRTLFVGGTWRETVTIKDGAALGRGEAAVRKALAVFTKFQA